MPSHLFFLAAATAAEHGESSNAILRVIHDLGINAPALIAQIINFVIVAFILYRFAVRPVLATIEERQARIADGLRYTEEMKAKLADAEKQHAATMKQAALDAQKLVDETRAAAKDLLDRETKQATEKAQQIITKAEEAIELDRKKMVADAREEIARLVALTASRVLSRELNSDERRRYAESAARELSKV